MRFLVRKRLLLVGGVLLADLLLMPAVARLPDYLPLQGRSPRLVEWVQEWLYRPVMGLARLVAPVTEADQQARDAWLALQAFMAIPLIYALFPERETTRDGKPVPDPSGAHGTARWRTKRELSRSLLEHPIHKPAPPAGILAGVDSAARPKKAYIVPGPGARNAVTNPHVLVIGASGAGKTRRLVLPNLWLLGQSMAAGVPNSILVTDPKGELYSYTARYFQGLGYKVRTLNLIDPRRSDRYDPIREIVRAMDVGDTSRASELAWDVAHALSTVEANAHTREDPFWSNAAESVVAATVLYVAKRAPDGQRNMATVYRLLTEYGQDGGELLDAVFREIPDLSDPARLAYGVTALSQDKTRAGILTTAAVNLRLFGDPVVADMTSGSDYDLAEIGQMPTVVYLLLPDDKSSRNAIAAMYLAQAYTALSRLAASEGGTLPVPTYWILDEFANIARFRDFDKWISVMRGRGMSALIVLQALQQLEARYGRETAAVITSNCDTWLFLRTNDRATAKEISDKLGQYTIRTRTASRSTRRYDVSTSTSEHLTGRPLLTPDEVLKWPPGRVLVLQAGLDPAELELADISLWPAQFEAGGPPPVRESAFEAQAPWLPIPHKVAL